jgi:hypothetical protein
MRLKLITVASILAAFAIAPGGASAQQIKVDPPQCQNIVVDPYSTWGWNAITGDVSKYAWSMYFPSTVVKKTRFCLHIGPNDNLDMFLERDLNGNADWWVVASSVTRNSVETFEADTPRRGPNGELYTYRVAIRNSGWFGTRFKLAWRAVA